MKTLLCFLFLALFPSTHAKSLGAASNKKCEDVLSPQVCTKLRNVAKIFHEKSGIVNSAVQKAIVNHVTTTKNIINFIKNYLVEEANTFKCEDVLSVDQCTSLIKIAGKFKVSVSDLTHDIKDAIADGVFKGKALYQKTIEVMLQKINNLSCEQLTTTDTCQKIKEFGNKVHVSSKEIMAAIIDAYSKGITNTKDFIKDAINRIVDELSCDKVLTTVACSKLEYLADKFGTSFTKIVKYLRESLANGVTQVSALYKAATEYIMKIWLGVSKFKITKRSIEMTQDEFLATLSLIDEYYN